MKPKLLLSTSALIVLFAAGLAFSEFVISHPNEDDKFTETADIAVNGGGALANFPVATWIANDGGIAESSASTTAGANGSFATTVEAPSGGWEVDGMMENHFAEAEDSEAEPAEASVKIKIIESSPP